MQSRNLFTVEFRSQAHGALRVSRIVKPATERSRDEIEH